VRRIDVIKLPSDDHPSAPLATSHEITAQGERGPRDPITGQIIGAAIEVHRQLGPGLLESAYRECLCHELRLRGFTPLRERVVPLIYKGIRVDAGYRADLIVDERILIELKCVERLAPIHTTQVTTYLRLSSLHLGLLINFNVPLLRDGILRVVL
jgi:GxxExxY protein